MAARSCGKTVTARSARVDFFVSQLRNTSLFTLQLIRTILTWHTSETPTTTPPTTTEQWRAAIVTVRSNVACFNLFYNRICDRYQHLPDVVALTVDAHVTLLGLEGLADDIHEPIHVLWLFLLKLVYTRPFLVMHDDDDQGSAVQVVTDAMARFVPESLKLKIASTLTHARLAQHNDDDDEEDENVPTDTIPLMLPPLTIAVQR